MERHLGIDITDQHVNLPIMMVDSEGMGVRGDNFDFMITSPPAIIAKVSSNDFLRHANDGHF